jgi:dGTPase
MPPSTYNLMRAHPDPLAGNLPPFVLDRQRIVHSAAFRRLQHKTQVFVAPDSDHFRTRLTHTLEVAHLARHIAVLLGLNAEFTEIVALAHDLGHPPFGHAGERALAACLRDQGGFEHNRHTLRIVEELEHPYPEFHGLNLTRAVRECLAKHSTPYDQPGGHPLQDGRPPPPEGLVVDLADRLAYAVHDLQDGLYANLVQPADLRELELWRRAYHGPRGGPPDAWRAHLRSTVDRIQACLLADIAGRASDPQLAVHLSDPENAQLEQLEQFLRKHVYRSERLMAADEQACCMLAAVFDAYVARPDALPPRFGKRVASLGIYRVVADYVAGMTDRFCIQEHTRLCDLPPDAWLGPGQNEGAGP